MREETLYNGSNRKWNTSKTKVIWKKLHRRGRWRPCSVTVTLSKELWAEGEFRDGSVLVWEGSGASCDDPRRKGLGRGWVWTEDVGLKAPWGLSPSAYGLRSPPVGSGTLAAPHAGLKPMPFLLSCPALLYYSFPNLSDHKLVASEPPWAGGCGVYYAKALKSCLEEVALCFVGRSSSSSTSAPRGH